MPGLADRLVALAETQSAHRQSLERSHLARLHARADRGQTLAFLVVVIALGGGVFLVANGRSVGGLVTMLAPLAIVAALFVTGEWIGKQEKERKLDEVDVSIEA